MIFEMNISEFRQNFEMTMVPLIGYFALKFLRKLPFLDAQNLIPKKMKPWVFVYVSFDSFENFSF